jgi:hypothetical protein
MVGNGMMEDGTTRRHPSSARGADNKSGFDREALKAVAIRLPVYRTYFRLR